MREHALRWLLSITVVVLLLVFGFVLFSPVLQVREIQVERKSPRLDVEQVQEALVPVFNKHLVFLPKFEVIALLENALPDIEDVSVTKVFPSTLRVSIELDPIVARLRILEPDEQNALTYSGATVDFLTDEGVYVATTSVQDIETLPEIVIVDWGVRPDPGTHLVDATLLERMNAAELTLLRQFGKEVVERRVFLRAQEFHVSLGDIALWFDTKSPLEDQLNRYRLFLREVDIREVRQYIDLRIADRVVYQ